MPNWCCNRLSFTGHADDIARLHRLATGDFTPWHRIAVMQGIQLFCAGTAGLLQATEETEYAPYPALTAGGRGVISPENLAFTRWLGLLKTGIQLDEASCSQLHQLWLESGIEYRLWETLNETQQSIIRDLYKRKQGDWYNSFAKADAGTWWDKLCLGEGKEGEAQPLDLLMVIPVRLDIEINGFNGGLLADIPSSHSEYMQLFGLKWPVGYALDVSFHSETCIQIDFDTPWGPPDDGVLAEMSQQFSCTLEHWYAEQGCDFCGYGHFDAGEKTDELSDSLEWEDIDCDEEERYAEVTGPEWIINNVANFGG
jgi:hypothetical protein